MTSPAPDAAAAAATGNEHSHHSYSIAEQDEGVLRDVLEELDKERSKRAELEAQIRVLEKEQAQAAKAKTKSQEDNEEAAISRKAFIAMEQQVQGFQQLVDALTLGKPAIAAAAESESSPSNRRNRKSLPLHVVRLLELIPWDPHAKEHIFGSEAVYEWQVYDSRERKWQSRLKYFPVLFKSLPIVKPKPHGVLVENHNNKDRNRNLLVFLAKGNDKSAAPSKHGVLTDERLTKMLNIEAGYPLPLDGGNWEWIGGWRIDKRMNVEGRQKVDCDDDGWSYARDPQQFLLDPTESVWDNPNQDDDTKMPQRKVRRRKWTRQRVLVDYPYASESTRQYLKLLAENVRSSVAADKISDQLVETKVALTEAEERMMQTKEEMSREIEKLKQQVRQKDELLKAAGTDPHGIDSDTGGNAIAEDFLGKKEVKDIGSKISSWVSSARKLSEDRTSNDKLVKTVRKASEDDSTSNESEEVVNFDSLDEDKSLDGSGRFDWRRFGRGALLDKIKQSQSPAGRNASQRRSHSDDLLKYGSTGTVDEVSLEEKEEELVSPQT